MQIWLFIMYFDSTGGATKLVTHITVKVSEETGNLSVIVPLNLPGGSTLQRDTGRGLLCVTSPVCAAMCCSALNICSVELLLKIGTLLMEMLSYEKTVDSFIELLRKDEVSLVSGPTLSLRVLSFVIYPEITCKTCQMFVCPSIVHVVLSFSEL